MTTRKTNQYRRARAVADMVSEHYEVGNQSKSLIQIYRNVVVKTFPIGERTFWRYMSIAQEELGYNFANTKSHLDIVVEGMRPQTEEAIKELANKLLRVPTANRSKREVLRENRTLFNVNYPTFIRYVNIAEMHFGYNFKFKETERLKRRKRIQRARYLNNLK